MKSVVLHQPGELRLVEAAEPGPPGPGEAVVRVRQVGICGTDWHAFAGRQPFFTYPRILGHELGVEVELVGPGVQNVRPGDRCAVEPYLNCGSCVTCRQGRSNCCVSLQCMGVHTDGGMRSRITVPAEKLHRAESLDFEQLALVETLAIGCHAVERGEVQAGESVLVIGAGPIGLSVLPFARAAGGHLIVMDISDERLAFCRTQMGIEHTINAGGEHVADELAELTGGEGPGLIFDATGNAGSMARTFELVAGGGRIVLVGFFQGDLAFHSPTLHRKEITLLATRNALPGDFTHIIGELEAGRIDVHAWITHRAPMAEVATFMPAMSGGGQGLIKAVIDVDASC